MWNSGTKLRSLGLWQALTIEPSCKPSTLCSEIVSLTAPGARWSGWLMSRKPQQGSCFHLSALGRQEHTLVPDFFTEVRGIWTQVFMLARQALYPLRYLSSLWSYIWQSSGPPSSWKQWPWNLLPFREQTLHNKNTWKSVLKCSLTCSDTHFPRVMVCFTPWLILFPRFLTQCLSLHSNVSCTHHEYFPV